MNDFAFAQETLLRPVVEPITGAEIDYQSFVTGVVYRIPATFDTSVAESETNEGLVFQYHIKDFRIRVNVLPVTPDHRDLINWMDPYGLTHHYAALINAGSSVAERDSQGVTWLIHCKEIPAPESTQAIHGNAAGTAYGNADTNGVAYGGANR